MEESLLHFMNDVRRKSLIVHGCIGAETARRAKIPVNLLHTPKLAGGNCHTHKALNMVLFKHMLPFHSKI